MPAVPRGKSEFVLLLCAAMACAATATLLATGAGAQIASERAGQTLGNGPAVGGSLVEGASGSRPNILLIVTDDQDTSSMKAMPQTLRRFKTQGVEFRNGYATTPLCCPSRASMFSGLYAHNHGIITNNPTKQFGTTYRWENTFPSLLQDAGYTTGLFGKYLNNWDKSTLGKAGFDKFKDDYKGAEKDRAQRGFADLITADRGNRFLRAREDDDSRPWMMTLSMRSPHAPLVPAEPYEQADVPPFKPSISFNEKNLSDKPAYLANKRHGKTLGYITKRYQRYQQTLLSADDGVESVFDTLKETGEERKTLAIFISDNGFLFGAHGLLGKVFPYREATNIPMYMRWPAALGKRAQRDNRMVANIDLAPTFYDVAGVDPGYTVDGESLFSTDNDRDYLLTESVKWKAIQDQDGSLIETKDLDGSGPFVEFYDWARDPAAMNGTPRLGKPAAQQRFDEMTAVLESARGCVGAAACP